jgi:hypothetical protein
MDENDPLNPTHPATRRADTIGIWTGLGPTAFGGVSSLVEGRGVAVSLLIALAILPLAFLTCVMIPRHRQITTWLWSFFDERSPQRLVRVGDDDPQGPILQRLEKKVDALEDRT